MIESTPLWQIRVAYSSSIK